MTSDTTRGEVTKPSSSPHLLPPLPNLIEKCLLPPSHLSHRPTGRRERFTRSGQGMFSSSSIVHSQENERDHLAMTKRQKGKSSIREEERLSADDSRQFSYLEKLKNETGIRGTHHEDEAPSGEWTPFGCCNQTECDHLRVASQQRSNVVDQEECLPCLGSSA
jgi:hypothetical protein